MVRDHYNLDGEASEGDNDGAAEVDTDSSKAESKSDK